MTPERLTGLDASFLYMETPTLHMHVAMAAVFDPSTVPGGYSFRRIRQLINDRIPQAPTATIPIVMQSTPNPVENGLVTNLPRPEANVTGTAQSGADNISKRLQLLKQMLPGLARLAIIWWAGNNPLFTELATKNANTAASTLGFAWQAFSATVPEDYDRIFAQLAAEGFDAAYVPPAPLSYANLTRIAELGRRHRVPTLADHPIFAKNGFLLTYGDDPNRNFVRSAEYVDKILRGSKPADLPVEQTTTFELVINLKTAKELGLTVPPTLLAIASEIIE